MLYLGRRFVRCLYLCPFVLPLGSFSQVAAPLFSEFIFDFLFTGHSLTIAGIYFSVQDQLRA